MTSHGCRCCWRAGCHRAVPDSLAAFARGLPKLLMAAGPGCLCLGDIALCPISLCTQQQSVMAERSMSPSLRLQQPSHSLLHSMPSVRAIASHPQHHSHGRLADQSGRSQSVASQGLLHSPGLSTEAPFWHRSCVGKWPSTWAHSCMPLPAASTRLCRKLGTLC